MIITPSGLARALERPEPTDEQAAVIGAPLGPCLVVAGAGSGKTETMASRVVYLVANGIADSGQILGLTFTRKAAGELAHRVRHRLRMLAHSGMVARDRVAGPHAIEPVIGTYHSFAGSVISEFGPLLGMEPPRRVLTPTASWQLARRVVTQWDQDLHTDLSPDRVTDVVLMLAGALADHLRGPDEFERALAEVIAQLQDAPPGPRQRAAVHSGLIGPLRQLADRRAIVPVVAAYDRVKRDANVVDFADQMQLAARLATTVPVVQETLRNRHAVVLLDEYQDTGHAQRVILRALFGSGESGGRPGHPVTAVGDPLQSIYGWRGASTANLPAFVTDFPRANGAPAPVYPLMTSFRNARRVLDVANGVSRSLRSDAPRVGELSPAPQAPLGCVRTAVEVTVDDENEWLADTLAQVWAEHEEPPSVAVLVRRRSSMAPIAAAVRARGIPVEVVGIGGLVHEPEVADVIAMMRLVVDHHAGPAAIRVLTGARWQLGMADLAALGRRARELHVDPGFSHRSNGPLPGSAGGEGGQGPGASPSSRRLLRALTDAAMAEDVDSAGLVDALADPGEPSRYSAEGFRRITALYRDLVWLRSRLAAPLSDFVADVERTIGIDVEVLLHDHGRQHLDSFGDVVAELASAGAGPVELLDYLAAAADREDGLQTETTEPTHGRVQVMTVHAAKGLEWDVVAVPHLSSGIFPSERGGTWFGDPGQLPPMLRGDRDDLPAFDVPDGADQSALVRLVKDHIAQFRSVREDEERRLFYVAVTRARRMVLLSGHHWGATGIRPRGPSRLLEELREAGKAGDVAVWSDPPDDSDANPLVAAAATAQWPVDPCGALRPALEVAATLVRDTVNRQPRDGETEDHRHVDDDHGDGGGDGDGNGNGNGDGNGGDDNQWLADARRLLAERRSRRRRNSDVIIDLPAAVTVSTLVSMADDPQGLARLVYRPVPQRPVPQARRGTAFHRWLERHFGGDPLLDLDELPGARDVGAAPDDALPELIAAFQRSQWASKSPTDVEVPFVTHIAGLPIRGRIDAVFSDPDGGATVVDWKTGAPPSGPHADAAAVQLAAYRIAWSRISGLPLESVRAAFHYVGANVTVHPTDVLDERGLQDLIMSATVG